MSDMETDETSGPGAENEGEIQVTENPAEALEAEIVKLKDDLLRALAETENVRRRMERQGEDQKNFGITKFAQDLLPVADNLRRAIEAVPAEQHDNELVRKVVEGIEATERALLQAFEKNKVSRIDAMGQPFDANFHEVMVEIDSDKPAGTVVQVFETGYLIGGETKRLLRPARVAVAKGGTRERLDTSA